MIVNLESLSADDVIASEGDRDDVALRHEMSRFRQLSAQRRDGGAIVTVVSRVSFFNLFKTKCFQNLSRGFYDFVFEAYREDVVGTRFTVFNVGFKDSQRNPLSLRSEKHPEALQVCWVVLRPVG